MTDTKSPAVVAGRAATTVGVVAESGSDERRVALVPKAVSALVNSGVAVVVESGAGQRALLPDELYTAAGATIGDAWGCDVVVKCYGETAGGAREAEALGVLSRAGLAPAVLTCGR